MREGLLWFDPDKRRTAIEKLDQAVARYTERFGRRPNMCHVNPDELFGHPSIVVAPNPSVLRGHFWLGVDEELLAQSSPRRRKSA